MLHKGTEQSQSSPVLVGAKLFSNAHIKLKSFTPLYTPNEAVSGAIFP